MSSEVRAWIEATLHGDKAQRPQYGFVGDIEHALRRGFGVEADLIADFGDGAEAEVDSRIVHAVDQDLPTVAQSWRLIRRFIVQLRNCSAAEPAKPTNGTGDSESADRLS